MVAYAFETVDDPAGSQTTLSAINNIGNFVGVYVLGTYGFGQYSSHSFVNRNLTTLPDLAAFTEALGINDAGQLVGSSKNSNGGPQTAFFYSNGTYTSLPNLDSNYNAAVDINNAGQIVGYYGEGFVHSFLYENGTHVTLDDPLAGSGQTYADGINDSGQIVGAYVDAGRWHGFLFWNGSWTTLPDPAGAIYTRPYAINNLGQIVGSYESVDGKFHAFLYSADTYTALDNLLVASIPDATGNVAATGINDSGEIVGSYVDASGSTHGFLATPVTASPPFDTGIRYVDVGAGGHAYGVASSGNFLYVAAGENGFKIVDVSNRQTAAVVGSSSFLSSAQQVAIAGNYAYVGDESFGIVVYDVRDPHNPIVVSTFPYGSNNPGGSTGPTDLAISGHYLYATGINDVLRIIDISNPAALEQVGSYGSALVFPYAVTVSGDHAYIGDLGGDAVKVIDISNPAAPLLAGSIAISGAFPIDIVVSGQYAYVADGLLGFYILDVSDPAIPAKVGSFETSGGFEGVQILGNYAYLSPDASGRLSILDISDPTHPTRLAFSAPLSSDNGAGLVAFDNTVYVADQQAGIAVLDVSSLSIHYSYTALPTAPFEIRAASSHGGAFSIGINDVGQVASSYFNGHYHGFLYDHGAYITVDDPEGTDSVATGVSNDGTVVGYYWVGDKVHGFIYDGVTYKTLDTGSSSTWIDGISSSGLIVGHYNSNGDHSFIYKDGRYTTLPDPGPGLRFIPNGINDLGQVIGVTAFSQGAIYADGTYTPLSIAPFGINNASEIVGVGVGGSWIYADGIYRATSNSQLFGDGINNKGEIVGAAQHSSSIYIATPHRVAAPGLVSADIGGVPRGGGPGADISADGRYVVFASDANNLVADDANGKNDVFVKDLTTGRIIRASTDAYGQEGNANSSFTWLPFISANGRYVAFDSDASNLVANDTNAASDSFVKDLQTGQITRVSTDSSDMEGNGGSYFTTISANGRYVVFESFSTNLIPDDLNGVFNLFVKDLQTGQLRLVSADATGSPGNASSTEPTISGDGRYVAFTSGATNLVVDDTNDLPDVFVKDLQTGAITRVSTSANGAQANGASGEFLPSISADGHSVVFISLANNLVPDDTNGTSDVFVKDLVTGQITRVSTNGLGVQSHGFSSLASISADGRYVTFDSTAADLVPGAANPWSDIFVKDLQTGNITLISKAPNGAQANGNSELPRISADGRYVVFDSDAANYVADDTDGRVDVFVVERGREEIASANLISNGDFSLGNVGFSTNYIYRPGPDSLGPTSSYVITDDPGYNHSDFLAFPDHTRDNAGLMLLVNGATSSNVRAWSEANIAITPNTVYELSAWVASPVSISPAALQFLINGVQVGVFTAPSQPGIWTQFKVSWNSTNNNTAAVSIVDLSTAASGNDFALDDLSLTALHFPSLFTSGADTVNFNSLTDAQKQAIDAHSESIYEGLGGNDVVTLPDRAHYQLTASTHWDKSLTVVIDGHTFELPNIPTFTAGDTVGQVYKIKGGDGNDVIVLGDGNDIIFGSPGNDVLQAGTGHDTFDFQHMASPFGSGTAQRLEAKGEASVLLPGSENDYRVILQFGNAFDWHDTKTIIETAGVQLITSGVQGVEFQNPIDNEVQLNQTLKIVDNQEAVEMIRLAVEAYDPALHNGFHLRDPLGYESAEIPSTTSSVSRPAEQRGWHSVAAIELGMKPADYHQLGGIHYSFVDGFFQAYNENDALSGDAAEADALVLTGIVAGKTTLAIAFTGTDQKSDWLDYPDFSTHYAKFAPLVAALKTYIDEPANGIEQVLVSGHSLGGAMVQEFIDDPIFKGDAHFNAQGWTIGSPGSDNVSHDISNSKITNFYHSLDFVSQVVPKLSQDFQSPLFKEEYLRRGGPAQLENLLSEKFGFSPSEARVVTDDLWNVLPKFHVGTNILLPFNQPISKTDIVTVFGQQIALKAHDQTSYLSDLQVYYATSKVVDGYLVGATVFADANDNGTLDLGEASVITDANGSFSQLGGGGTRIAFGGTDISTGQPFIGRLEAPTGATVITPLTTLLVSLQKQGVRDAESTVLSAFGLDPSTDLLNVDPYAAALAGDPNGSKAYLAGTDLMNIIVSNTSSLFGASGVAQNSTYVFDAFANFIAHEQGPVDLHDPNLLANFFVFSKGAFRSFDADAANAFSEIPNLFGAVSSASFLGSPGFAELNVPRGETGPSMFASDAIGFPDPTGSVGFNEISELPQDTAFDLVHVRSGGFFLL